VFQAKLRGWRRLAAGLVLVPGLTGLGADALGLLGRAAGQDRPTAGSRADEIRDLQQRAREAYNQKNYGLAADLSSKADALKQAPATDDGYDDRPVAPRQMPARQARPATTDAKTLVDMAKQALTEGNLDKAEALCNQAQANSAGIRWGLFDDTPASVLKDVQKARGRRDKDSADRLLAEARALVDKPASTLAERAANLSAAEEKARQAAGMHGSYSMLDFGDRPAHVLNDVRRARDLERIGDRRPVRPETMEPDDEPTIRTKIRTGSSPKTVTVDDRDMPTEPVKPAASSKKGAAIALMQEGKALEIGRNYVGARKKYIEAAKLNAPFAPDEASPETELSRLDIAAGRKIAAWVEEAKACIDRKEHAAAKTHLEDAHALATGMGLDASMILEVKASMKAMAAAPVIRTKSTPMPDVVTTSGDQPMPVIRSGRSPVTVDNDPVKTVGGDEPTAPIPPAKTEDGVIKPIPPAKPMRIGKADGLPEVPDIRVDADSAKPPMGVTIRPMEAQDAKGQDLLKAARAEFKKGDYEAARKIAVELINGPYGVKDEAVALLKSCETADSAAKMDSARRAFDKGMEAYQNMQYAQALAIFQQIDGTLLPAESRKKLAEMVVTATAKKKEADAAVAARNGDKLPSVPKPGVGLPDMPPMGLPAPTPKTGPDSLVKQQEALTQVEFQRLRSKSLRVESEATTRFGKGETDAALQDLQNYIAEVKASPLDPAKQNLLVRPIEARMERLRILKHQTDFLTKEAKDRHDFTAGMTQDALYKEKKQEETAKLIRSAQKLMDEAKYKEAYVQLQKAQSLDSDDPAVNATMQMAERMYRMTIDKMNSRMQESGNFDMLQQMRAKGEVTESEMIKFSEDPEVRKRLEERRLRGGNSGSYGVSRVRSEVEKQIERKMHTPLSVNFKQTPLDGVVDQLHAMTGINFNLDLRGLKESNLDSKQPITTDLKDVSLKSALDIICQQAGLKHVIESEVIRITTPKLAAGRQVVKSLSVGDLVVPAPNYGATPSLQLSNSLDMAAKAAYGILKPESSSTLRTPHGALPNGTGTGNSSSMDLPGSPGRLRNTNAPSEGGAMSNTGPASGTLERELIRLITTTIKPDSWMQNGGEGTIEYFPLGLAMVINQSPEVIEEVERLLESLRKLQDLEVSIEVKVVSLAETFYERIGVDFSMGIPTNAKPNLGQSRFDGLNHKNFTGNVAGLQVPGIPTPDLDIPIKATSFARAVPPFGGFTQSFQDGGISLGMAFLSDLQVQMFLEAAQGDTRTNVMQAPKLTALNGTSASMTVGDFQFFVTGMTVAQVSGQLVFLPQNVPFAVGITQPIPPNASIQNGLLNFTPTAPQTPGLGLFIQPVVSADRRFVRLNIQQSFTSLISGTQQIPITTVITPVFENGGQGQPTPFTQFLQQPRFSNLETQTVVVVPDGGTVVMGGLKYMTEGRNEFGPPVLSKIPYLNRLFKNVAYGREGRSILIMVTPRVIINREEQERQTGVRDDDFIGVGVGPGVGFVGGPGS
jgi:type II secretory pathway component GspD/PulD (secretin)/tetratricopeptide (TPR) repeat protein